MNPNKIIWLLGYNNLSLILDEERKHWLMKTDKKKQIQDRLTGDLFQGQIDNIGSDIIIESEKLARKSVVSEITFKTQLANRVFEISSSVFPHSAMVNGLLFARIVSTNYSLDFFGANYKIKFTNAEECIIPFGASNETHEVYAGKWIRTSNPPIIMRMDENGLYTITEELMFSSDVTGVTYYYPLTETLQPFGIVDLGYGEYELDGVNNDEMIGYPLFWFTCDQSNIGSNLTFENNTNDRNEQIFFVSNEGNSSKFNAKVYTGVSGTNDGTPDGSYTTNYVVRCSCMSPDIFTNAEGDFGKKLDPDSIYLINNSTQTQYKISFKCNEKDTITMSKDRPWSFIDDKTYEIEMSYFDQNCLNNNTNTPLVSIFDVNFDESVPFDKTSSDVGFAGVRMSSSSLNSDVYDRYPRGINKWEGLPTWMNNLEDGMVPEHLVMYAFHQPPSYNPDNPESMQGAGIILDPGVVQQNEPQYDDTGNPIINNDEIGRVYVISNDDLTYKNNATTEFPKPARTAARICDIPTSVMQLTGVSGLSPNPIVDNKYVRTEANYTTSDKDRLYNTLTTRWVRPTALTKNGKPVYEERGYTNRFAFETNIFGDGTVLNTLDDVDLINHNNFRYRINLNPLVDVTKISVASVYDSGKDYVINDIGVCVIGGYSFTYVVEEVDENGGVTKLGLVPDDRASFINLSNFDMPDNTSGVSEPYGTSPTTGKGTGLKFKFSIDYDYFNEITKTKGEIYDDLFAFVRERTGLYVYQYEINKQSEDFPKTGRWVKRQCISEFEVTSTVKKQGGVSTQESYINSIIPSVRDLPITLNEDNADITSIVTLQTASFINIIDKTKTPVKPANESDAESRNKVVVDLCKFYCDGLQTAIADKKDNASVKAKLTELNVLRFDSYVIWRWVDPKNGSNASFEYGIVTRGFNNLFTTDEITMLPTNELKCDNFVHTNGNTTIVWDVEGVGVMMWIYDPTYTKKESYWIDPATRELHVTRTEISYKDIDIRSTNGGSVPKIVEDGKYMFNIMTNNPMNIEESANYPIYQQPDMTQLNDALVGMPTVNTSNEHKLCGNWRLVFPRVQSFRLTNDTTNTEWIPTKMQTIKGRSISNVGVVLDSSGNDVSTKSLIIDEGENISLKMFNPTTGTWEKI